MSQSPSAQETQTPKKKVGYTFRGQGTSWYQPAMWWLGKNFSRLVAMILFRVRFRGRENYPLTGPVLLVTNHQSFLDPWLVGIACPRQVHYMARDSLFKGGFFSWVMECVNAYPVRRGTADLQAIRHTVDRLKSGYVVNIFPEGTRCQDGTIGPIAAGVAIILARAKMPIPIVPVLIEGAFEAWPRNQKIPGMGKVVVTAGKQILPEELANLSSEELAVRIRRALVDLQKQIGSPHAEASAKRLAEESAAKSSCGGATPNG